MDSILKIETLNAVGLNNIIKKAEYLSTSSEKVDIICLQGMHLKQSGKSYLK